MYKSLTIKNIRCFKHLEIDSLERVNLIAGANNVGKTVLLEALWINQAPSNPTTAWRVNIFRGLGQFSSQDDPILHSLFYGFDSDTTAEISTRDTNDKIRKIKIRLSESPISRVSLEDKTERDQSERAVDSQMARSLGQQIEFTYFEDSKKIGSSRGFVLPGSIQSENKGIPNRPTGIFLAARSHPPQQEEAERFGKIDVFDQQDTVLKILRHIEPRLSRLSMVVVNGVPTIHGDIGLGRLLPIPLLGDGLGRLLSMSLAIMNAEGGIVLVDEFENGFYHTTIVTIWKAIASLARQFDVQLVTTTHSEECIKAAHQAFEEDGQYDFRLHRLTRVGDSVNVVTYDLETLSAAIETGLEMR